MQTFTSVSATWALGIPLISVNRCTIIGDSNAALLMPSLLGINSQQRKSSSLSRSHRPVRAQPETVLETFFSYANTPCATNLTK